ncbi:TatD family hydrolase [Ornithinibacillus sp. 4-3]|uniref:TatD family hydrolase n=1 Tax=Ornithinibacillus sp. 4-3 TaxID=3231488 RepID=A0AB39HNG9_9BACI
MQYKLIDSHIHFDQYSEAQQQYILSQLEKDQVEALIAVSTTLSSSEETLQLARKDNRIKPAFGYHPEQALPDELEIIKLLEFIQKHQDEMIAVGEVGLPYYSQMKKQITEVEGHIELLDNFVQQAAQLKKPIVLHAVYEDASIACDILEKYSHPYAHFHWFKGDKKVVARMISNKYMISITPDVLYESAIKELVKTYPLELIMVETDGPWPFTGPFEKEWTKPRMMHAIVEKISKIKEITLETAYTNIYKNTKQFYRL